MLGLCLVVQLILLYKTGPYTRSHDTGSHINYVHMISHGDLLPSAQACWQCYHPPVYYWIAGGVEAIGRLLGVEQIPRLLQIFSLLIFEAFLFFGFLILRQTLAAGIPLLLGSLFLFLWPSGFFHGLRIGNDVLFYFFHTIAVWAMIGWSQQRRPRWLGIALGAAILALFTKANGFMTLAVVVTSMAMPMLIDRLERNRHGKIALGVIVIAAVSAGLFVWLLQVRGNVVTNAAGLPAAHKLANSWKYLLGFDPSLYFDIPFYGARYEDTGRQYYWIVLLKSSLYGEWWASSSFVWTAASVAEIFLLPLVGVSFLGLGLMRRRPDRMTLAANAILLIVALGVYRWRLPYGTSPNFRYIYPVVVSGAVLFADGVRFLQEKGAPRTAVVAQLVFAGFLVSSLLSVVFF